MATLDIGITGPPRRRAITQYVTQGKFVYYKDRVFTNSVGRPPLTEEQQEEFPAHDETIEDSQESSLAGLEALETLSIKADSHTSAISTRKIDRPGEEHGDESRKEDVLDGSSVSDVDQSTYETEKTPPYTFDSLPGEDWIRLLKVEPGKKDDPISCSLQPVQMKLGSLPYTALSYHWGDGTRGRGPLLCNGKLKHVSKNLYGALEAIRDVEENRILWVDAICINQDDMEERNHQVSLMRRIYEGAQKVIVWVGHGCEQSMVLDEMLTWDRPPPTEADQEQTLLLICQLANTVPPETRARGQDVYFLDTNNGSIKSRRGIQIPAQDHSVWHGVAAFFNLEWFWRVWVIQEVSLASTVELRWGRYSIDFHWVGLAALWIRENGHEFLRQNPQTGVYNAYVIYQLWIADWQSSFVQLLQHTRQFELSDARDRVYGLLGLSTLDSSPQSGCPFLVPDYRLNLSQVYTAFAIKTLCEHNNLEILSCVQHLPQDHIHEDDVTASWYEEQNHNPPRIDDALPSWVPDWNISITHALAPPPPNIGHLVSANVPPGVFLTGNSATYIFEETSLQFPVIQLEGLQFSEVSKCLPPMYDSPDWEERVKQLCRGLLKLDCEVQHSNSKSNTSGHCPAHDWRKRVEGFYERRSLAWAVERGLKDWDEELKDYDQVLKDNDQEVKDDEKGRKDNDQEQKNDDSDKSRLCAFTVTAGRDWYGHLVTSPEDHTLDYQLLMDRILVMYKRYPHRESQTSYFNEYIITPKTRAIFDAAMRVCNGRRFFRTAKGNLGLGPAIMEKGDIICVLFGGPVPYVLRPAEGGKYRLLGECYVYDIMNGEAVEEWKQTGKQAGRFALY